jgi:hypothetical protein
MTKTLSSRRISSVYLAWLCVLTLTMPASAADETTPAKSAFSEAVDRGLAPNGSLWEQLYDKGQRVETHADVRAFVRAIKRMQEVETYGENEWSVLSVLLYAAWCRVNDSDDPEDIQGRKLFVDEAGADLVKLSDKLGLMAASADRDSCLLDTLELLAWCNSKEGKQRVLKLAKANVGVDETGWYSVFDIYFEQDRDFCQQLLKELSAPLPSGYLAAAYLKMCNLMAMSQSDFVHPFNSEQGLQRMTELFSDRFQCYLHQIEACATDRIAPEVAEKFFNAMIEQNIVEYSPMAALRSAQRGFPSGLRSLQAMCSDLLHHRDAVEHLKSLGRADLLPSDAISVEFTARSDFLMSLVSITPEYARNARLEVVAKRQWKLPGDRELKEIMLLRYTAETEDPLNPRTATAFHHGTVFRRLDGNPEQWHIDDAFASYCGRRIRMDFGEWSVSGPAKPPSDWNGGVLELLHDRVELRPSVEVNYPCHDGGEPKIAVAAAEKEGKRGFAVFDGSRSEWYDRSLFPVSFGSDDVLEIHVGRVVLGLPHRIATPLNVQQTYPNELVIQTYEQWLAELEGDDTLRRNRLLFGGNYLAPNPLALHFDQYLDAVAYTKAVDRNHLFVTTFERILQVALQLNKEEATSAFSRETVLNQNVESYISLLRERDAESCRELLLRVEGYNDQRGSRLQFAKAAVNANMPELARAYFEKAMKDDPDAQPLEVAELWFRHGDRSKANELLHDVIQSASDRDRIISWERLDKAREAVRILKRLEPGLTDRQLRIERRLPAYLLGE